MFSLFLKIYSWKGVEGEGERKSAKQNPAEHIAQQKARSQDPKITT